MLIIPAIDIKNGKVVRLWQGDFKRETVYGDPAQIALDFAAQGAKLLHIIDLDGAKTGKPQNLKLVRQIIQQTGIPVQLGGGLRDKKSIQNALAAGVAKVIIGTLAVREPQLLFDLPKDKIIIALDVKNERIMLEGWQKFGRVDAHGFLEEWKMLGVKNFIYTDVARDGTLQGPDYENIKKLISQSKSAIYLAGGVGQISDLEKLSEIGAAGVVVGRAMYTNEKLQKYVSQKNYTLP